MVYEWNVLRVVACLSIVLLHATTQTEIENGVYSNLNYQFFRVILCYATPTFVLLSIIILAERYKDVLPRNFLTNRFKYVYLPFLSFSLIYAAISKINNSEINIYEIIFRNVIYGDFPGWFVLTIIQLYLIFWVIKKFKLSGVWIVPVMVFSGLLYLTWLNKTYSAFVVENSAFFRMFFLAWILYFAVAYCIGTYYESISHYLLKYRYITILLVIFSIILMYVNYTNGITNLNSRRIDIVLLVVSMTLTIIAFGQKMPRWKIVNFISKYAFGIYLVHRIVQQYIAPYTAQFDYILIQVVSLFILSTIGSVIAIKIVSLMPFSEFIVGKIKYHEKKERLS